MKKLMAAMLSFVMAMMLLAGCASASTDNTFSDPMQQVSLSNDEMLTSLNNATAALQENINKTDDSAKVELVVADDGSCSVYASDTDTERQELCKADSVKAMFEIYYENNWMRSKSFSYISMALILSSTSSLPLLSLTSHINALPKL